MTIKNIIFAARGTQGITGNILSSTYFSFETTYGTGNFTLGTPSQWGTGVKGDRTSFANIVVGDHDFAGASQTGSGDQGGAFFLYRNGTTTTWIKAPSGDNFLGPTPTILGQRYPLIPSGLATNDVCNIAAVIGDPTNSTTIRVYKRTGQNWALSANLPTRTGGMTGSWYAPAGVAMSPSGEWIAYGSPNVNVQTNTIDSTGSFTLARTTDGGTTFTTAYYTPANTSTRGFGLTIAFGGNSNVMAVSESNTSSGATNKVVIYNRSGTTWTPVQTVSRTAPVFGYTMSISRTASRMAITELANVAGYTFAGQVCVYSNVAGTWQMETVIQPSGGGLANNMYFGSHTLQFDEDGQTLLIGSYGAFPSGATSQGAGYIYKRGGGNVWNLSATLHANLLGPSGNNATHLGYSGTINYAGTEVLLSAFSGNTTSSSSKGAVFYYNLS